ncbi:hypothetical protein P153DRAFT_365057 [Dothidotthia symphoricarpi CBS 119687]|uniref:Methyltransferase domain-containing protein n=1 Tax=Dothidotthia symphoricarpi CBS 119687 TaxID=1392245 RepID=A0A6A6AIU4_9PLEO|nr:uncharacterized protein P153DRAFT_365057 [Dothidotthia symphoricarpi CBS 119687]KAF2131476.1 hypothetical protein P153DRAFT_365057 [Dothidotthia symphoricarpi CBS 119687]
MPSPPPAFGSQGYWNHRFAANSTPFEWLEAPTALDPFITDALKYTDEHRPELLHVGCGTSLLSFHLRVHVDDPQQIHNLDYSEVAIDVGKKRESEICGIDEEHKHQDTTNIATTKADIMAISSINKSTKEHDRPRTSLAVNTHQQFRHMRWDAVDLLSHRSLLGACNSSTYSVIVDKSTSDSIACADDVDVPLPYPIGIRPEVPIKLDLERSGPLHPLYIMAVHLALVIRPRGRWISLSYSQGRYPFVNVFEKVSQDVIDNGFPDPGLLWKVVGKHEIDVPEQQLPNANNGDSITHRPKTMHWVYVLERTDVPLFVRGSHI